MLSNRDKSIQTMLQLMTRQIALNQSSLDLQNPQKLIKGSLTDHIRLLIKDSEHTVKNTLLTGNKPSLDRLDKQHLNKG